MSAYINPGGDQAADVPRPWLRKVSDITDPPPAKAFVFADEHPVVSSDGVCLVLQPGTWIWVNFPDTRHQKGANLSFADGHVEHWRWREGNTLRLSKAIQWGGTPTTPGDRDLAKFQECIPHAK